MAKVLLVLPIFDATSYKLPNVAQKQFWGTVGIAKPRVYVFLKSQANIWKISFHGTSVTVWYL